MFAGVCLGGFFGILRFGLLPVTVSRFHEELGEAMLGDLQYPSRALDRFQRAIVADPRNVIPRQRIAEVASYRLSECVVSRAMENPGDTGSRELDEEEHKLVSDALFACEALIRADRRNSVAYRLRADVRWNSGLLTENSELQELALQDLQTVTNQYPSSVDAWFRLTKRLAAAGVAHRELAKVAADRTLQLDQINHEWGHSDRFLTEEQLATVKAIAGV